MKRYSLAFLLILPTLAAQDVPAPPKPGAAGPSLAATMGFIQDKLNGEGDVRWVRGYRSGDQLAWTYRISGATADENSCTLAFRQTESASSFSNIADVKVSFKNINKLTVLPLSVDESERNYSTENTPVTVIRVNLVQTDETAKGKQPTGDTRNKYKKTKAGLPRKLVDPGSMLLYFNTDEMAQRVAKAMIHAVELCGGAQKDEPF
ncbi:MAG: hypothetical protein WBW33_06380 [Bryobacteraceae bacterium]